MFPTMMLCFLNSGFRSHLCPLGATLGFKEKHMCFHPNLPSMLASERIMGNFVAQEGSVSILLEPWEPLPQSCRSFSVVDWST
uniref:Uncharacterized protein n=1 Tax=Mus musculus TaxID=10090 RepID=Q6R5E6_MOUSE|nr:unknown [Mus musculus]